MDNAPVEGQVDVEGVQMPQSDVEEVLLVEWDCRAWDKVASVGCPKDRVSSWLGSVQAVIGVRRTI
jgi:hypothetical protein